MSKGWKMRLGLAGVGLVSLVGSGWAGSEVVVYSARNEQLIKPIFDAYTAKSGVAVQFVTDKEGPLLQRLVSEAETTPADLLITVDAGNLWDAGRSQILSEVKSTVLDANIPAHLRDPDHRWYGLSVRARTVVYNRSKVKPEELSTYEALAEPPWKGRLCLRTSKKVYNQSLVGMMIARMGAEKAETVVRGWVNNLAIPPLADDTQVMEAIAAGQCDLGVVNTYYFGRLMEKKPGLPLALYWPNQGSGGVHVNISGAGVTRHAKHRAEAVALLEWLSTPEAQRLFADVNLEFPANPAAPAHPTVTAWGTFKGDDQNVALAGQHQVEAVKLMDRAGYK